MKCPVGARKDQEKITKLQMEIKDINTNLSKEIAEKKKIKNRAKKMKQCGKK